MTKGAIMMKEKRKKKHLSQIELSNLSGIPRSTIACIESQTNYNTSVATAKKLSEILKFNWTLFFEEE